LHRNDLGMVSGVFGAEVIQEVACGCPRASNSKNHRAMVDLRIGLIFWYREQRINVIAAASGAEVDLALT